MQSASATRWPRQSRAHTAHIRTVADGPTSAAGELGAVREADATRGTSDLVLTLWDWSSPTATCTISSARPGQPSCSPPASARAPRTAPTKSRCSTDTHRVPRYCPVRDRRPVGEDVPMQPSPYWGDKPIWDSKTSIHNPIMDEKGRVWFTARVRPPNNPDFCKKGSSHPSARVFPINTAARHLSMYDPATAKWSLISTCFPTHHLIFAEDANNTLWTSSGGGGVGVVGWLNRKLYEETGDEARAQGWTPFILDTNGNGRRDAYTEPNQPPDPAKDRRVATNLYAVAVNPVDGSVWGTALGFPFPGYVVRVAPGSNSNETALTEVYEPPLPGYAPRGGDIDRNGVYWVSLSSGHLGSFDRRKCKGPLNGPTATGKHCPEGWTLYPLPGPQFKDLKDPAAPRQAYYTWWTSQHTRAGRERADRHRQPHDSYYALVNASFIICASLTRWPSSRSGPRAHRRRERRWQGRSLWATNSRARSSTTRGKENRPGVEVQMPPTRWPGETQFRRPAESSPSFANLLRSAQQTPIFT